MKFLTFIVCFLMGLVLAPELSEIRKNYPLANDNKEVAQKLHEALSGISKDDKAILIAFKGGASTIMAKHAKGIRDKKTFFKEGVSLLEHAIEKDPNNIEIRCIRLGVQENSPKFLKYKDWIEVDKNFIIESFSSETSKEIKDFVKGYIMQSSVFSTDEKQLF